MTKLGGCSDRFLFLLHWKGILGRVFTENWLPQVNHSLGAVHVLRQPPEGVEQMLTIADEGGRGGKPNTDHC